MSRASRNIGRDCRGRRNQPHSRVRPTVTTRSNYYLVSTSSTGRLRSTATAGDRETNTGRYFGSLTVHDRAGKRTGPDEGRGFSVSGNHPFPPVPPRFPPPGPPGNPPETPGPPKPFRPGGNVKGFSPVNPGGVYPGVPGPGGGFSRVSGFPFFGFLKTR